MDTVYIVISKRTGLIMGVYSEYSYAKRVWKTDAYDIQTFEVIKENQREDKN